mmetsp:Transcript_552/g.546  ORF Transcript_552/g.546 Transcript_552/m.546 type:complete len:226 (+) Transcript_552:1209-1886(+)
MNRCLLSFFLCVLHIFIFLLKKCWVEVINILREPTAIFLFVKPIFSKDVYTKAWPLDIRSMQHFICRIVKNKLFILFQLFITQKYLLGFIFLGFLLLASIYFLFFVFVILHIFICGGFSNLNDFLFVIDVFPVFTFNHIFLLKFVFELVFKISSGVLPVTGSFFIDGFFFEFPGTFSALTDERLWALDLFSVEVMDFFRLWFFISLTLGSLLSFLLFQIFDLVLC